MIWVRAGGGEVYTFSNDDSLKVNIMVWLEFKFAYFEATAQQFGHYDIMTNTF